MDSNGCLEDALVFRAMARVKQLHLINRPNILVING
jgi:hypothetical protein